MSICLELVDTTIKSLIEKVYRYKYHTILGGHHRHAGLELSKVAIQTKSILLCDHQTYEQHDPTTCKPETQPTE